MKRILSFLFAFACSAFGQVNTVKTDSLGNLVSPGNFLSQNLIPGSNVTLTPQGNQLIISSSGGGGGGSPGGTNGQVQYNNNGNFGGFTLGGDASLNTSTGTLTFSNVNSNVGTFAGITVNAKGLVTGASALTTLSGYGIIDGVNSVNSGTNVTGSITGHSLTLGWTGTASPAIGGTGVNNGSSTFTTAGNVAFIGAFPFNATLTGTTNVTFPTSGTLLTGNQNITLSGDTTGSGATAITTTTSKVNGVAYSASPSTNTVPVVTSTNTISYEAVPNAALANSSITIGNAGATALGGSATLDSIDGLSSLGIIYRSAANTRLLVGFTGGSMVFSGGNLTLSGDASAPGNSMVYGTNSSGVKGWYVAGGGGTLTNFSAGNLSPLFTTSVATSTTTPNLTFSLTNAGADTIFGNTAGTSGAAAYNSAASYSDEILNLATNGLVKRTAANTYSIATSGTDYAPATSGSAILSGNGSGGFSSVGYTGGSLGFSGGNLTLSGDSASPGNSMVYGTNGSGTKGWYAAGSGSGTVTSVALSLPSFLTVSGSPVTTSGTLTGTLATQSANTMFGNDTGSTAAPVFDTVSNFLDSAFGSAQGDILYRGASGWTVLAPGTSGNFLKTQGASANPIWAASGGSGTVTSVTFTGDGILDSSTPSTAVTTSGTVTATVLTQSANTVLAGPASGGAVAPTFRALVAADMPSSVPATTNVQTFASSGTWTMPANAKSVSVICWGGGGGGGGGFVGATSTQRMGGPGGGGGARVERSFSAASLPSSVTVTVGSGGNGGASASTGTAGTQSTFGSFCFAGGGGAGPAGTNAISIGGGGGGGSAGNGNNGATSSQQGGNPGASSAPNAIGGQGGGGELAANGGNAEYGGGGGGGNASTSITYLGGSSEYGAGGGGTGGQLSASNTIIGAKAGGASGSYTAGGGGAAGATDGAAGTAGSSAGTTTNSGFGGGGGNASIASTGGTGGAGGAPGGGGGGGGAAITGQTAGSGGNGGAGQVIVITYF